MWLLGLPGLVLRGLLMLSLLGMLLRRLLMRSLLGALLPRLLCGLLLLCVLCRLLMRLRLRARLLCGWSRSLLWSTLLLFRLARLFLLVLRERRYHRTEKQKQGSGTGNSKDFHINRLH